MYQISENQRTEFKSSFNDAVIETLCAFANTKGGKVYIGIDNKGLPIKTFNIGDETIQKWINEIKIKTAPSIIPEIEIIKVEGKIVISMEINEFPIKPVACRGRYYKRIQNSNHLLSIREISDLHLQTLQTSWDAYEYPGANLTDLETSKITQFISRVNEGGRFLLDKKPLAALEKLRLVINKKPSNAAMLLFSTKPLNHSIHIGRFKTPSLIIDDKILQGGVYELIEETMRYLIGQIKVASDISGESTQRNEIFEYPIPALRELVLNAIVHRDYTSPVDIQIKVFDNSITIFNPGKLYGGLTIEELKTDKYQSQTRNKLLAEALYLTKDIEKYGSGYIRVRKEIRQYPTMLFEYQEIANGLLVSLSYTTQKTNSHVPKDVLKDVPKDAPKENRLKKILALIHQDKYITQEQMADACDVNIKTIKRDLDILKTQNRIERKGGRKEGYWEILVARK